MTGDPISGPLCRKEVRLLGRRLFTITGLRKHKWNTDVDAIPDTTVFQRVDCVRCGFSVDGVALKRVRQALKGSFFEGAV
jgi:hypothetical protein